MFTHQSALHSPNSEESVQSKAGKSALEIDGRRGSDTYPKGGREESFSQPMDIILIGADFISGK